MNVFKLCVATVFCFMVASCSNEDLDNVSVPDQLPKTKSVENVIELSTVAQLIASMEMDQAVMDEIKGGVDRSLSYGLDEEFRFIDMLQPTSSKLFRNTNSLSFVERLKNLLNSSSLAKGAEVYSLDILDYLSQNDIQIYWPYSKKWDGKTRPVITYLQEGDENYRLGYILNEDSHLETVSLDKEFVKNNPVWIINQNETSYDELPDFENGEFVNKDGVFFYSEIAKEWLNRENRELRSLPIPRYVPGNAVYIGSINSKNNHDGGLAGGPEFDFIWCHAGMPISGSDPTPLVNRYRINVSTSDVGSAKQIDLCIQPNWTTQEITNALIVIEKDGGKDKNGHVSLSYNYWGKILPVDVSYKYEKRDDFVFEKTFNRSDIFGDNNKTAEGTWKQYNGDEFWVNLPTK